MLGRTRKRLGRLLRIMHWKSWMPFTLATIGDTYYRQGLMYLLGQNIDCELKLSHLRTSRTRQISMTMAPPMPTTGLIIRGWEDQDHPSRTYLPAFPRSSVNSLQYKGIVSSSQPLATETVVWLQFILSARRYIRTISTCIHPLKRRISPTSTRLPALFSHRSPQCCLSCLSTTWFRGPLLTRPPSHLLTTARWRELVAPTSRIVAQYGALYGAVLSPSFRVLGSPLTPIFLARRSRTPLYRLSSIAFLCSFVRCLYPSTYWPGR